jgi:hypothetical protein
LFPRFSLLGYWIGASPGVTTLVLFLAFTMSVLFVCLGIVGEYLIVLLQEIKKRPSAIVADIIGQVRANESAYSMVEATSPDSAQGVTVR